MDRNAPRSIWQYKASWRSTQGYLTILLLLLVFIAAWFALGALWEGKLLPWLPAAFLAWLCWLMGRPLFTGEWVLRMGPPGITGAMLKQHRIPWHEVRDVRVDVVQGHSSIVLTLVPQATESLARTRRLLNGRKPERAIPLGFLTKAQIAEASAAVLVAFAEHGGENARAAQQARAAEERAEAEFLRELAQRAPVPAALYAIVALNVGVWVWNVAAGVSPLAAKPSELFEWGANSAWAVVNEHQYWRLLTSTFLHGGLMHLAMNMLGLWSGGKLLNRMYGNLQFLAIYLASALAGSAASLHFSAQTAVSVGASGAIFGVISALVATVRLRHERIPAAVRRQVFSGQGVFLFYALANGFGRQGVDNAAHVGGLLAGAALAWLLTREWPAKAGRAWGPAAAAFASVAAVFALVVTTPAPVVNHRTAFAAEATLQTAVASFRLAQGAMQKDVDATRAHRMTEPQLADALERAHLPALRQAQAELRRVQFGEADPRSAFTGELLHVAGNSVEGSELLVRILRGQGTPEAQARFALLQREVELSAQRLRSMGAASAGARPH